jgi:pyruvate/2-oxoglutarate dehydrogenase complex dihydrolipoamide dehydrogenase (E3) component
MPRREYDVLILGGGNAGLSAADPIWAAGLSVAVVEERDLGGTCPNRKVLVAAAHSLHEIAQAKVHCIKVGEPRLDWTALINFFALGMMHGITAGQMRDMIFAYPTFAADITSMLQAGAN